MKELYLVAAVGTDSRVIGDTKTNNTPWPRLPTDMKMFADYTMGHPVIMGRLTWESLPAKYRPLPGRTNIVLTNTLGYKADGAIVVHAIPDALETAQNAEGGDQMMGIGGGKLYAQLLPFAHRLRLTLVDGGYLGDVLFPPYEDAFVRTYLGEDITEKDVTFRYADYVRR